MLPCKGCAYRASIPGNCHIRCTFDWNNAPPEVQAKFPRAEHGHQWFIFPFNYDPTWGPDECPAKSDTAENVAEQNPWADLLSLMG